MPLYVIEIDAGRHGIIVGPGEALSRHSLTVSNVNYIAGAAPGAAFTCSVRLRYKAREWPALVTPLPNTRASIVFDVPQRPISPGQAAVFYSGDEVLGGGIID